MQTYEFMKVNGIAFTAELASNDEAKIMFHLLANAFQLVSVYNSTDDLTKDNFPCHGYWINLD